MNNSAINAFLYTLVCLIWGTTWISISLSVDTIPPLTSAGLRFLVAFPFICILLNRTGKNVFFPKNKRKLFLFVTAFYFCIPYFLINFGGRFISSGLTAIIFSTTSIFMVIFSILIEKKRVSIGQAIGVVSGFIFLSLLIAERSSLGSINVLGCGCILLAAVFHALSYIVIRKYGNGIDPLTLNTLPMGIAGTILSMLGFFVERPDFLSFSRTSILALIYLSLVASVLGFASYFYLLKRLETSLLSYVFILFPGIAVAISLMVEKEPLTPSFLFLFLGLMFSFLLTKVDINKNFKMRLADTSRGADQDY